LLTVQPGEIEGVEVHDIRRAAPAKPLRYLRSLGVVRSILDEIEPDLLNTHFLTGYGYWGDFSGFHPNVVSVWGDDVYVTPHENPLKNHLARRALRNADAVTGDSLDILRSCVRLGAAPDRCFEVLWGVDFSVFRPDRGTSVRERLRIPADAPVLFSPRSFTQPYYNLDIIIEACARVRDRRPDVHVVFAGYEGNQEPFIERARQAGLHENTHFVGRIPHAEFAEYLVAADVFISVPSVDATAVSLLEAMSCRCAIVVSSLASSVEWIHDGVTGRVVPPRDVDALVSALADFVESPSLRARCGAAAMELARDRAGSDANFWRAEQIYRWLVEGRMLHESVRGIEMETEPG
jgi:glycosyltransferase involved in cell wall biosynthesis